MNQNHVLHMGRPLTSIIKNMPTFGEREIAPSPVVFYNTSYL